MWMFEEIVAARKRSDDFDSLPLPLDLFSRILEGWIDTELALLAGVQIIVWVTW